MKIDLCDAGPGPYPGGAPEQAAVANRQTMEWGLRRKPLQKKH
ncbi:hypothetical protein [Oryzomonas sagensis]|nr:hypothetical protein [Oryzomonas sagensis]